MYHFQAGKTPPSSSTSSGNSTRTSRTSGDVRDVFCDTGLEYPEVKEFVRSTPNVTVIRPKMRFREVILRYGYPVISKKVAKIVYYARKGSHWACSLLRGENRDGTASSYKRRFIKYASLVDAPFPISDACCNVMKKSVMHAYQKETGRVPFIGTLAAESEMRKNAWRMTGCNSFSREDPHSTPLAFWTQQDILRYIMENRVPYCPIYGEILPENPQQAILPSEAERIPLRVTGVDRTGCMFCMFGVHLEKQPNRFQRMKKSHPKIYEYCMRPVEEGGLGLDEVLAFLDVAH